MLEMLSPVLMLMTWETAMMPSATYRPPLPTTHGRRRYMMTPRIVRMLGVKTPPNVPNFPSLATNSRAYRISAGDCERGREFSGDALSARD